jgi:hypothetical protein
MNNSELIKQNNRRAFKATCSESEIFETDKTLYKFVSMFGNKTLIYWKKSGKISVREGHKKP